VLAVPFHLQRRLAHDLVQAAEAEAAERLQRCKRNLELVGPGRRASPAAGSLVATSGTQCHCVFTLSSGITADCNGVDQP